jgi:hypothetical protein
VEDRILPQVGSTFVLLPLFVGLQVFPRVSCNDTCNEQLIEHILKQTLNVTWQLG